jgi:hypothetical protein
MEPAATMDVDDEEQAVLDAAGGATQVRANLCAELREEASASAGRSARAVARAAHTDVLHANGPPGWANVTEVLNEVDNDESDDFADFADKEDAPDISEEQQALVALFETAHRDRAAQQLMAAERQAHREARDMAHRALGVKAHRGNRAAMAAWGTGEDMDLMNRVAVATMLAHHRQEARETATIHEAATARCGCPGRSGGGYPCTGPHA